MNTNRKCLKQILAYLLMLVIIMENVCMPQYHIFAKTNTAVASDEEYIVGTGIFESPGHEFIENSEMNSVMPFSLMPEDYGNTSKVVHDQGFSLCCWAFAGVSLFEYKVDKEENVTNTFFSAEHLVEKTSKVGKCGFTSGKKDGGFLSMFSSYFVSGYGPVSEEQYPWGNDTDLIENYDFGRSEYRATDIRYIADERNADGILTNNTNNIIKEAVYNNGAVYCRIYMDPYVLITKNYLGSDNVSHYVNDKEPKDDNHAVLIVGWDDNWSELKFKDKPESKGAWLVRNSWGSDVGDKGYYWVSYADHTIDPEATICQYEKMDESEKVYNLDESGRNTDWKSEDTQQGFINVFDIENKEKLSAVTIFESSLTAKCQIFYVPINSNGIPDVSQKVAISDEVSIPYSGYHTIPVKQSISLEPGMKCGIMVYVKNSNNKASIGAEYTTKKTKATLNKGESFLCDSLGNITDFKDKNLSNYGNFSIKLVTENLSTPISECTVEAITNKRYNGNHKKPTPEITYNGIALTNGKDYTLSYENNVYAGTATVVIKGIGNYTGTRRVNFTILKAKISECTVAEITDKRYNGNHKTPTPEITYNGMTLVQGTDYTMSYANNVNAGTATATITGIGNYQGTRTVNYTIKQAKFAEAVISDIGIQCYTGTEIHPTYTVTFNNNKLTLKENVDYTVSYINCTNAGTATLKLTGKGNYSGTQSVNFTISPANISSTYVYGNVITYTGTEIIYNPTIKYNDIILKEGMDYTISYSNNINAGKSPMKITGINNFTGTRTVNFTINPVDISKTNVSDISEYTYTGAALTPKPVMKFNNMTLKEGTDYTLSYSNNIDAGTATITITGLGNYTGTRTLNFTINKAKMSDCIAEYFSDPQLYTGSLIKPKYTMKYQSKRLIEGVDYYVSYSDRFEVGTGMATFLGTGNFTGIKIVMFEITNDINYSGFENWENPTYTGKLVFPKPIISMGTRKLIENVDYTVSVPANSIDVGEYEMVIQGIGEYAGTMVAKYNILPANISSTYVYGNPTPYTGSQIIYKPTIKYNDITLKEGVDYTISYSNNINAGKSPMKITGINNFTGTRTVNFTINAADISKATISSIKTQGYSGSATRPKPTITFNNMTLTEGTDYTLSYSNNVEVGWATITITGIGNFTGTTTTGFEISNSLQYAKIYINDGVYDEINGTFVGPGIGVLIGSKVLTKHVDYVADISPENVDHCGTYYMYITGIGKYTSTVICQFNVVPANTPNNALFSNQGTDIEFRQVHKPTLEIDGKTLTEGVDYDAYFVGNVYVEMPLDTITELNNFTTVQPDILDIDSNETAEISK